MPISGIVVMGGVQVEVFYWDVWIDGLKFTQGNNGAYAVVSPGIEETDMHRQVNAEFRVMGTEHVKGMAEIKGSQIGIPSPVSIWVREASSAGTVRDAMFPAAADLMAIRG